MKIEYRNNYFNDFKATQSFERYAMEIHNLDFSLWKSKGLWDKKYIAFSAFSAGECIASICVYPSEMKIDGIKKKGAQLLTVGTLPEYRLKGIQKKIWQSVQDWTSQTCDFVFLFTDESAAGFYENLGLKRLPEYIETTKCPRPRLQFKQPFKKLYLENEDDYKILERLSKEREMVSNRVGFKNPNLLMFMFLYVYHDKAFYIEEIDTVVLIEVTETQLLVHDIIYAKKPCFSIIETFLSRFGKEEISFLFCTDQINITPHICTRVSESILFVSSTLQLEGKCIFPYSIRA